MTHNDKMYDLDRLYDAARDDEIDTLDALVLRAGIMWKCSACGEMNHEKPATSEHLSDSCDGCASIRAGE